MLLMGNHCLTLRDVDFVLNCFGNEKCTLVEVEKLEQRANDCVEDLVCFCVAFYSE